MKTLDHSLQRLFRAASLTPEQRSRFEQIEKEQRDLIWTKLGGESSTPRKKP